MLMMVLLLPAGVLGGYGGDPDGVNGSWEKASTGVSVPMCVRVALATGEHAHRESVNFTLKRSIGVNFTLISRIVKITLTHGAAFTDTYHFCTYCMY